MVEVMSIIGWTVFGCVFVVATAYCIMSCHNKEFDSEVKKKEIELEIVRFNSNASSEKYEG